ncbi:YbaB/EbfC family nucleoid-associated protein [Mangrovivirga cuniculi]|uniref:Nucleoid-associated protein DCC35_08620 n=1 Tax=Mangrovivirga cuniculi TaxID=2715131 RepID=A0A4D7JEZ9_9BACT|nr:YbaB/EbfC family nucleoid-associated protein [Mangrovivirga cuniculi]QCK14799.1 DNA-binding protein [Mangrovivirga cuniculi]
MFDLGNMMGKIKEAQKKMEEAKAELANIQVKGEAGAGMVIAIVNCQKQVVSIEINESLINPDDREMIQDLTVAAINKAMDQADEEARAHMKSKTEGMIPNIPGLDLDSLMK